MNHDWSTLNERLRGLRLPAVAAELVPRLQAAGHLEALQIVDDVFGLECEARTQRRVERLLRAAKLPVGKTFDSLDQSRFPVSLQLLISQLQQGDFVDAAHNVLCFGLPGTGKSHVACALGHHLVSQGCSVRLFQTYELVQHLLAAKRDLELPKALRKLDRFEVLILDDIGYVQQDAEEIEVLFTLLAERYERRSLIITSNLVFSKWDQIFKNPMTTAAAIDRLVHHSVILEFDVASYRTDEARRRNERKEAHDN